MLDNIKRKELLSKARQAGFPGSILDVFSAYEQGRDLIAEYQQEQKMKQAQQMSDFVVSQTLQQPQIQQPQQAQQQLPSSPPVVQANVPVQMSEQQQPLVDSSRSTNVGIVPNQTGSYKGEAIFAKGGFKSNPPEKLPFGMLPPMNTLNPVEVKATRFDTSKYPDLGINQPLPTYRPVRKSTLEEEVYWNQVPDFYKKWGKDGIGEDVLEFLEPTGIMSHDDAKRAYESWKESGRKDPTPEEGLEMFGAVPALGKFGKIKYVKKVKVRNIQDGKIVENVIPVTKYIPWQEILNTVGFGRDMSEQVTEDKKAKGGFKKDPPNQGLSSMGAENRLYTYKTDPNWFDNRSTYSDNSKYSDQIRHAVYSGNYGYNPVTGVLEKLPTNKRTNVSTETQRRLAEGENKQAYQKSIVDAGFNPETFAKPTAEEEKALEDRRIKDYVIKGHELAINNPVFKAGAYLTPAGMAVGAVEGTANFLPDVYNFAENPSWGTAGKLGMDALLAAPIARQLFKPQINSAKSVLTQLKGEVTQGRANREAIKEGNDWLKNWIEHPSTQAKIDADMNAAYNFRDVSGTPGRLINLIKDQSKTFKPASKEYGLTSQLFNGPMHQGNAGVSYMHQVSPVEREFYKRGVYRPFDEYGSFISRDPKIPQGFRTSTTVHEGTHDWVSAEALKKSGQRNIILKNLDPKSKENFLKWEELTKEGKDPLKFMSMEDAYSGYLADPTEVHARIMELRKAHEIKPGDVITPERSNDILEHIKSGKTKIDPEFAKTIDKQDPKKLAELFNRLWVAAPATGVGIGIQNAMENKAKGGFKGVAKCYTCKANKLQVQYNNAKYKK